MDHVVTPEYAWKLTPYWLVLLDPEALSPPGHPIHEHGQKALTNALLLTRGGIGNFATHAIHSCVFDESTARWSIICTAATNSVAFGGTWDGALQRGFVESIAFTRGPEEGHSFLFEDWTFASSIDRWVAHRVRFVGPTKQELYSITFQDASLVSPEAFDASLRVPDFDAVDAHRGRLMSLVSSTDLRVLPSISSIRTEDGIKVLTQDELDAMSYRARHRFRQMGWSVSGAMIAAVLFARFRFHKSDR
ncbi:MAG: hypothetical protein L0Y42_08985 [Phycisphaerales bacterium]|nr:hypothetical protein [Phycisphaerales bacterium]